MSSPPRLSHPGDDTHTAVFQRTSLWQRFGRWLRGIPGTIWLLLGILFLAFGLRELLVHYGMPLLLYEDEPIYYDHALNFGLGHWHLAYFKKPSFFLYFYALTYYLGYLCAPFLHWKDYVDAFWRDPSYVAIIGRTVSVLFATGSVWMLYRIGKKAFCLPVGMAAAFLLAVDPTHLRVSPIVISDVPALFFILSSAWFALHVSERGAWRDYLLCALMISLAISFKYNAFCAVFLLAGHLVRYVRRREESLSYWRAVLTDRRFWSAVLLVPVVFAVLNFSVLFDLQTFWRDLNFEKQHMLLRNAHSTTEHWRFMTAFGSIFGRILPRALSWPLYVLGLLGFVWMPLRYRLRSAVLLSFPLLFLLVVLQFQLINAKYLLPVIPFLYLSGVVVLHDLLQMLKERCFPARSTRWVLVPFTGLLILLALSNLGDDARYVSIYGRVDTRSEADAYIRTIAKPGDHFLLEPDTLTLDNRLFRAIIVDADYDSRAFRLRNRSLETMWHLDIAAEHPRYVMVNFTEADRIGKNQYKMPYPAAYYAVLQRDYHVNQLFAPYAVFLEQPQMQTAVTQQGMGGLYALIQQHKSSRKRPGPLILLMERNASAGISQ